MAPTQETTDNLIMNASGRVFTMSEAFDLIKTLDSMPTGSRTIRWINVRTGREVVLGITGGNVTYQRKKDKKPKKIFNPFLHISQKDSFKNLSRIHSKRK